MSQSIPSIPDRYERDEVFTAPRARVWAALTEPDHLAAWFATPSFPIEPGGAGTLRFRFADGTDHDTPVEIVVVEPTHLVAFRWRSHGDDPAIPLAEAPSTLVEITLSDAPGGTRLHIVESGFATLPEAVREASLRDNTQGWGEVLGNLASYLGRAPSGQQTAAAR